MQDFTKENRTAAALLIIAAVSFFFYSGEYNIPIVAWSWPALLLYILHSSKSIKPFFWIAGTLMFVSVFKGFGMTQVSVVADIGGGLLLGASMSIPFLVEKILRDKYDSLLRTLIFPTIWEMFAVLNSVMLYGSLGNAAATQVFNLPFVQSAAVVGVYGTGFIIMWANSVFCYCLENKFDWEACRLPVSICISLVLCCFVLGGIRTIADEPECDTAVVATAMGPYIGESSDEWAASDVSYSENKARMKRAIIEAGKANADMLVFNEEAFFMEDKNEREFVSTAGQMAKKYGLYVLICMDVEDTDNSTGGLNENKSYLLDKNGKIAAEYTKNQLVPLIESPYYVRGTEPCPVVETPFGTISWGICFDADFEGYIRKCLKGKNVDLFIDPSWDWKPIHNNHSRDVACRAIENGCSVLKVSYEGHIEAWNYLGERVYYTNVWNSGYEAVELVEMPMGRTGTVYSIIGGFFKWIFPAGGLAFIIALVWRRKE